MTTGPQEIELKFLADATALDLALAAAPAGHDETRDFTTVYFDTPAADFAQAGASLRIRQSGQKRVQTLKLAGGFSRREHEQPVDGWEPDRSMDPLPALLAAFGGPALSPAFRLKVFRRQRLIEADGVGIELALDLGEIFAGERSSPVSELELELKAGPPSALFDMARRLMQAAPLYLSFDGKAAQGRALLDTVDADRPALTPQMSAAAAFQTVARADLAALARQAQALRRAPDAEAVHGMRVAARRLRSQLSIFKPLLGPRREGLSAELKWLAKAADEARNLDVFLARIPADAVDLTQATIAKRAAAGLTLTAAVGSARFRALLLEAAAFIETGDWLQADDTRRAGETPVVDFAASALDRRFKRLRRHGRKLGDADDAARHALRIEAKRLRYAAEAMGGLFPQPEAFVRQVKHVQTDFGGLNDAVTARAVVKALGLKGKAAKSAKAMIAALDAQNGKRLAKAHKAYADLAKAAPFWS